MRGAKIAMTMKKSNTKAPIIAGMSARNMAQFFFALLSRRSRTSFVPSRTGDCLAEVVLGLAARPEVVVGSFVLIRPS